MLKAWRDLTSWCFPKVTLPGRCRFVSKLFAVFEGCIYVQYSVLKSPHNNCRKWDLFIKTPLACVYCAACCSCMLGFHSNPPSSSRMAHWNNCFYLFIILSKNHPTPSGKVAMREYKGKCSECMLSILRHNAMAIILMHIRYSALEKYLAVPTSRFSSILSLRPSSN